MPKQIGDIYTRFTDQAVPVPGPKENSFGAGDSDYQIEGGPTKTPVSVSEVQTLKVDGEPNRD